MARLTRETHAATVGGMVRVRGTCVALEGFGVLLRGQSGSGKSDLALRLIREGAHLVSDDYTEVKARGDALIASAPTEIAGLLEVRGLGILRMTPMSSAALVVCIDLVEPHAVPRMPEPKSVEIESHSLPLFRLAPFEASTSAKVRLAVRLCTGGIMRVQ